MDGERASGGHAPGKNRALVPFWAHQLAELMLAVAVLIEGVRTNEHTVLLVTLGVLLMALAVFSDGGFGVWPLLGRRTHRVLDLVAAGLLAAAAVVLANDSPLALVVLLVAAAAQTWLAFRTNWAPVRHRSSRRSPRRAAAPAPGEGATGPATPPAGPAARRVGAVVGRTGRDGPRRLGRTAGRIARSWRPHGPDHE